MPSEDELASWEKAARKDNPSYWSSQTLVHVFNALQESRSEAAQLRLKLANATCDALVAAHARGDKLQESLDEHKRILDIYEGILQSAYPG